ncbi:stabilin-2-like [Saccostrea echinata]|uniref:stabilin-2-like n=1 Tax=Saccostrea echinata TaxID=191078 RepID=UPI002A825FF8|nr:stabilin-2-like [Saccostrea echinata]
MDVECEESQYGLDCLEACGSCRYQHLCNHVNGTCRGGCKLGYKGDKCDEVQGKEGSDWQSRFYGVLAALCVCVAVLIVFIVVMLLQRRRKNGMETRKTLRESQIPQCEISCVDVKTNENDKSEYQELGDKNLAYKKPTWQSTSHDSTVGSEKAVDGLYKDRSYTGKQCSISSQGHSNVTWWVNLIRILSVHHLVIYYRTDNLKWDENLQYTSRFLGFSLYISNTTERNSGELCFHDTEFTKSTIPDTFNTTCTKQGQYVIYYNSRPQNNDTLRGLSQEAFSELCEVEVYGCNETGYYGSDCSRPCPDTNCRYCHIETGACQGCKPGYQGHQCEEECDGKMYGDSCKEECGTCLGFKQCHHVNGSCPEGCDAGYEGELCKTACSKGKFGVNCKQNCSMNCALSHMCNGTSGECEGGCKPGWEGLQCNNGNSF